jgi:hypothetical protein
MIVEVTIIKVKAVVLIECLECGEEESKLGDEIELEWEEVV